MPTDCGDSCNKTTDHLCSWDTAPRQDGRDGLHSRAHCCVHRVGEDTGWTCSVPVSAVRERGSCVQSEKLVGCGVQTSPRPGPHSICLDGRASGRRGGGTGVGMEMAVGDNGSKSKGQSAYGRRVPSPRPTSRSASFSLPGLLCTRYFPLHLFPFQMKYILGRPGGSVG